MAEYRIFFKSSVWKDFKSIPDKDLTKILSCIESLGKNLRQSNCKKLSGQEKYRMRYGRYRIVYSIQDEELTIWIVRVAHRKNVYR
ncbi:Plasmid stabilization system [Desulfamplus magnetovallimortis]|uniref:Plasmid stabilization system n=1 Tax=Desulfamplus magnetovallimortis TaxID=1246637 RepID=A0A1W1H9T6_9BACT|nr:type II toxin-antitoxin system RelE/ParE family toxin [Desulfamplus magnetovallimortis]SLM29189.1 Plasmid stabilization system [Desulfamplus magnetovallimortis]